MTEDGGAPDGLLSILGPAIELGPCIVGANLNLAVIRGFAPLFTLGLISAPDVYDQEENQHGTQRELRKRHATECFAYATGAMEAESAVSPRAFPEVLLNVRDLNVLELYEPETNEVVDGFDSFSSPEELKSQVVGVRVHGSAIDYPKEKYSPQISRVDGNHRLSIAEMSYLKARDDGNAEALEEAAQLVTPFALFVNLLTDQEARLFRDINSEHVGMETAHLDNIDLRTSLDQLKSEEAGLPLWIAHELQRPGRAFADMIFLGGSKKGVKDKYGRVPPITINALKNAIGHQLKASPQTFSHLRSHPEALVQILDHFWSAVSDVYSEAWQNKKDYVLLQSIGLNGMAQFGGTVVDRAFDATTPTKESFVDLITPVAESVSLLREDLKGVAGAGGATLVRDQLLAGLDPNRTKARENLDLLGIPKDPESPLDTETEADEPG